jgi:hypothetical protein
MTFGFEEEFDDAAHDPLVINVAGMSLEGKARMVVLVSSPMFQALLPGKLDQVQADLSFAQMAYTTGADMFRPGHA